MPAKIESLIRFGLTRSELLTFLNCDLSSCVWHSVTGCEQARFKTYGYVVMGMLLVF